MSSRFYILVIRCLAIPNPHDKFAHVIIIPHSIVPNFKTNLTGSAFGYPALHPVAAPFLHRAGSEP